MKKGYLRRFVEKSMTNVAGAVGFLVGIALLVGLFMVAVPTVVIRDSSS